MHIFRRRDGHGIIGGALDLLRQRRQNLLPLRRVESRYALGGGRFLPCRSKSSRAQGRLACDGGEEARWGCSDGGSLPEEAGAKERGHCEGGCLGEGDDEGNGQREKRLVM